MTERQIEFMEYMEKEILPRQKNLPMHMLQYAGNLVGIPINIGCRSCAQAGGIDILKQYKKLLPEYAIYLAQSIRYVELEDNVFIKPELIQEEIIKDIVETDMLPVLNDFKEVNKTETYHQLNNERKIPVRKPAKKKLKSRK